MSTYNKISILSTYNLTVDIINLIFFPKNNITKQ